MNPLEKQQKYMMELLIHKIIEKQKKI